MGWVISSSPLLLACGYWSANALIQLQPVSTSRDHVVPVGRIYRHGAAACTRVSGVEFFFTVLMVLVGGLTSWFAVYVVYRLYTDK